MQVSQLLPPAILQWGSLHDCADMVTMYQSRVVVARLQTVNGFFLLVTKLGEALNGTSGRPLLDGLHQRDKLFSIRETFPTVDGYVELLPELLPVQHLTVKCGSVQLGKLGGTLTISGRGCGVRGVGIE